MGKNSSISWTDHTFNPWWGCTRVSRGCEKCYAETFAKRVGVKWGPQAERRFFGEKHWNEPLKWNREAEKSGERRRVFCASMADVFEDRPELIDERLKLWALIDKTPNLDWLLLTKRSENMAWMAPAHWSPRWPGNVWAMTSVENQEVAAKRILHLLEVPAVVHGLSVEPLLGPLNLRRIEVVTPSTFGPGVYLDALTGHLVGPDDMLANRINWVIVGGESGGTARPFDLAWARVLVAQGREAGTAIFLKQVGARPIDSDYLSGTFAPHDRRSLAAAKVLRVKPEEIGFNLLLLKDKKGGDPAEWPEDLRVRETPEVARG